MMRAVCILTMLTGAVLLFWPIQAFSQEEEHYAGLVEKIRCPAYWKRDASAEPKRLYPKTDEGRRLYIDERVRCDGAGFLRLQLYGGPIEIRGPSKWFPIPRAPSARSDERQETVDAYGRTGGRDKGGSSIVFSPSNRSAVIPGQLVIRWIPDPARPVFILSIQEKGGDMIWHQKVSDGRSGYLISDTARQALAKYRTDGGRGPLLLKMSDPDNPDRNVAEVVFSLLSVQGEQALKQEIAYWDKETGSMMLHLGRAHVFNRHRMFTEAAEEYEAALEQAPESRDLLITTILAHRRTGNFVRGEELTKRLPQGTKLP